MKKISYFLILFTLCLFSDTSTNIESFLFYKSTDKTLTIENIKNKEHLFQPLTTQSQLNEKNVSYWIKIELSKTLESSRYVAVYRGFDFEVSSLKHYQKNYKTKNKNKFTHSFFYNKGVSNRTYYFKVTKTFRTIEPNYRILNYNRYSRETFHKSNLKILFMISSLILGMIVMVLLYNLFIYFYYRKVSFLYYTLMELSFVFIMLYDLGLVALNMFAFYALSLSSGIWAVLFMRTFFNMAIYLPKINKILSIYILDFLQNSMKEHISYCTSSFILNLFELAKASPSKLQNKI